MISLQDIANVIEIIKTSTGTQEVFDFNSVCKRLIEITAIKKELENVERILKNSIKPLSEHLPYKDENGNITVVTTSIYEQDIAAIKKAIPEEAFMRAVTITKSKLSDDKEELRRLSAIVDSLSTKVGERESIKVSPKTRKDKQKGTLLVKFK